MDNTLVEAGVGIKTFITENSWSLCYVQLLIVQKQE